jgi:hypothetical protein
MKKLHLCASAFVLSMTGLSATSAQAGCSRSLAADACMAEVTRPGAHEASNANPDNDQAGEQPARGRLPAGRQSQGAASGVSSR